MSPKKMSPKERPDQLDSPFVANIIKWGSRLNTRVYRLTGGRLGNTWRVGAALRKPIPVCLLTTVGRRSGQPRTVPLLYLREGGRFVLVASQGGLPKNPAWSLNLREDPEVVVEVWRERFELVARTASEEERAELWPRLVEMYADFDTYDAWTERTIPVVICE